MPIARLSAVEAGANLRRNRASIWPDGRISSDRLRQVAKVSFEPSFTFSASDRILTVGSCFAREIEHRLHALGFDLPMKQVSLPREERQTKTENDIVSKFTVQSMENEIAWALGESRPPPPEKLFLEVGEGLWHDPQLVNNALPASLDRVIERRAMVQRAFAEAPSCRVTILTLGLAEAWFDHETSLYLNTAPPPAAMKRYPGRFSLDVLSYDEILRSLQTIYKLLKNRGHPDFKMLITVSPVPFKATFTGQDAIAANSYSKSVQRAACEAFVRRHDNVTYFPSYEIVTMSDREEVYEKDNVHIGNAVVRHIVDQVLAGCVPDLSVRPARLGTPKTRRPTAEDNHIDLLVQAKHLESERQPARALQLTDEILERFYEGMPRRDRWMLHNRRGVILTRMGRHKEAVAEFEKLTELSPAEAESWSKLGMSLRRAGRRRPAIQAFRRALEINPFDEETRERLKSTASLMGWIRDIFLRVRAMSASHQPAAPEPELPAEPAPLPLAAPEAPIGPAQAEPARTAWTAPATDEPARTAWSTPVQAAPAKRRKLKQRAARAPAVAPLAARTKKWKRPEQTGLEPMAVVKKKKRKNPKTALVQAAPQAIAPAKRKKATKKVPARMTPQAIAPAAKRKSRKGAVQPMPQPVARAAKGKARKAAARPAPMPQVAVGKTRRAAPEVVRKKFAPVAASAKRPAGADEINKLWREFRDAFKRQDDERAAVLLRQYIKRFGHDSPHASESLLRMNLGSLLLRLGRIEDSLRQLDRAVALDPTVGKGHAKLATALSQLGRSDEALHHFQRAVELSPDAPNFHFFLGEELARRGDPRGAQAAFRRCLDNNPAHPFATEALEALEAPKGARGQKLRLAAG